jgi:hypothetical protein
MSDLLFWVSGFLLGVAVCLVVYKVRDIRRDAASSGEPQRARPAGGSR